MKAPRIDVLEGWGSGGMVGVRKAAWRHEQTMRQAERILAEEHGVRHEAGTHSLCPRCREMQPRVAGGNPS